MSGMMRRRGPGAGCLTAAVLFVLVLALASGLAYAQLSVTNLIGFGAKRSSAAAGASVTYITSSVQNDSTDSGLLGTSTFSVSNTKDANTTMIFVATVERGENDNTQWATTPGTAYTVTYCGSPMTYVTGSVAHNTGQYDSSDDFEVLWWYIRGPSSGACTLQSTFSETTAHADSSEDPPASFGFLIFEVSGAKSSGDPFEGVNTTEGSGTSVSLTLTPTLGTMALYAISHEGSIAEAGAAPSVNLGSVDINLSNGTTYHHNGSHYDAAGAKAFTWTWAGGASQVPAVSGFHILHD